MRRIKATIIMQGTLGVIGCGNMGAAIVRGIVADEDVTAGSIYLYDKDLEKARALAESTGCSVGSLPGMIRSVETVLIAVKPQNAAGLFREIGPEMIDQTVISVMAGVPMSSISEGLGGDVPVVRAMPNIGAFVRQGVTCLSCNDRVKDKTVAEKIFSGVGTVLDIEESAMDAVTAVSGSGPAYVFYLAGAMVQAAVEEGLDPGTAETLVKRTIMGAGTLLAGAEEAPGELADRVASKGGTTEVALDVFKREGLAPIIKKAVSAAAKRSRELSEGFSRR
ncbi:MAG: pyrroline-5-carboxylate reductase [Candidatus Omnitrophica bacterium]|nr:pyrroline-5-carboxylate reductase [Candidatus Omnitrophota bacterium]